MRLLFLLLLSLPAGNYFYDAQALDVNGETYTFARGQFVVEQDRTK